MFHHPEPKTCSLRPRSTTLLRLQEHLIPLAALPPLLKYDEVITWPTCRRLIFLRWCKYIKYIYIRIGRKNKTLSLFPTPSPALSLSLTLMEEADLLALIIMLYIEILASGGQTAVVVLDEEKLVFQI